MVSSSFWLEQWSGRCQLLKIVRSKDKRLETGRKHLFLFAQGISILSPLTSFCYSMIEIDKTAHHLCRRVYSFFLSMISLWWCSCLKYPLQFLPDYIPGNISNISYPCFSQDQLKGIYFYIITETHRYMYFEMRNWGRIFNLTTYGALWHSLFYLIWFFKILHVFHKFIFLPPESKPRVWNSLLQDWCQILPLLLLLRLFLLLLCAETHSLSLRVFTILSLSLMILIHFSSLSDSLTSSNNKQIMILFHTA